MSVVILVPAMFSLQTYYLIRINLLWQFQKSQKNKK